MPHIPGHVVNGAAAGRNRLNQLTTGFNPPPPRRTLPQFNIPAPPGGVTPGAGKVFFPKNAPPLEAKLDPTKFEENPILESIRLGAFRGEEVQHKTLPGLLKQLQSEFNLPQIGEFVGPSGEGVPETVSLIDTLNRLSPGGAEGAVTSTFRQPEFTGSDFVAAPTTGEFRGTQSITPNVLEDPRFKAFERQLEEATEKQSQRIIEEQSRRGILSSGATEERFGKLGESSSRAIADVLGSIASPLISESILQESIRDPIRRGQFEERGLERLLSEAGRETQFGRGEAGRRTAFDIASEQLRGGGEESAIERAIGLSGGEQAIQQRGGETFAGLSRDERNRVQDFINKQAGLGFEQDKARLGFQGSILDLINAALSGGPTGGGGGGLGALVSQQGQQAANDRARLGREQTGDRARLGREQTGDIASGAQTADIISSIISLLPRNHGGNVDFSNILNLFS